MLRLGRSKVMSKSAWFCREERSPRNVVEAGLDGRGGAVRGAGGCVFTGSGVGGSLT